MTLLGNLVIPLILVSLVVYALFRGTDIFSAMTHGAKDGLKTVVSILPSLIVLLPAIYMFRASGAMDALSEALRPLLYAVGIPSETVPLMLMRPLSGSGALAIGSDIMKNSGPDSFVGRVAAVMLGSSETTFYVIAVYFGAAGIKNTRHAIPAALLADFVGFLSSVFFVRLFFGH